MQSLLGLIFGKCEPFQEYLGHSTDSKRHIMYMYLFSQRRFSNFCTPYFQIPVQYARKKTHDACSKNWNLYYFHVTWFDAFLNRDSCSGIFLFAPYDTSYCVVGRAAIPVAAGGGRRGGRGRAGVPLRPARRRFPHNSFMLHFYIVNFTLKQLYFCFELGCGKIFETKCEFIFVSF